MAAPPALDRFAAAPDLAEAIAAWQSWLETERRLSVHTGAAYMRDLKLFLDFLVEHRGGFADLAALEGLGHGDFRSYLAQRAMNDRARSSTARALSVLRGFFRFLERTDRARNDAIGAVRTPRLPHSVPKPVAAGDALAIIAEAGDTAHKKPWVAARDTALLLLLYGAGLRIDEALSLNEDQAPSGDSLRVLGKGGKERIVPILPAVREAVAAYLQACPYVVPGGPLFLGARGGRLNAGVVQRELRTDPGRSRPAGNRDAARAAPQLRDPSAAGGRRSAGDTGAPGPRLAVHHAALYRGRHREAGRGLQRGPSARPRADPRPRPAAQRWI